MFTCDKCAYRTKRKDTMRSHEKTHKNKNEELFKFDKCNYKTIRKYALRNHENIHKNINEVRMWKNVVTF